MRIDAKKRGGSEKRAESKIEKRQGGKEARRKEPLSRRGIVAKDVEERIRQGPPGCESTQNLV